MDKVELKKLRDECGAWDDEIGCVDDYPDECPFSTECEDEANEEDEQQSVS